MGDKLEVGGDVDAYCTRCKMDLAHTIVAMVGRDPVQVKCNTCDAFHKYRPPKSERGRRKAGSARSSRRRSTRSTGGRRSTRAAPSAEEAEGSWLDALSARAQAEPRRYDVRETFTEDDVIEHPKFGKGAVVKVLPPNRMRVLFSDEERVLVMNHGRR
ncbi:MAG: hypothetical protein ACQEXJ_24440 [Myxococcota bacterium]